MNGQRLDTRLPTSQLTPTVLAAVAQFERELCLSANVRAFEGARGSKYRGRVPTARRQAEKVLELKAQRFGATEIGAGETAELGESIAQCDFCDTSFTWPGGS